MTTEEKLKICVEALAELVTPKGAYKFDRLKHATETIKETSEIATEALTKIGEIK